MGGWGEAFQRRSVPTGSDPLRSRKSQDKKCLFGLAGRGCAGKGAENRNQDSAGAVISALSIGHL